MLFLQWCFWLVPSSRWNNIVSVFLSLIFFVAVEIVYCFFDTLFPDGRNLNFLAINNKIFHMLSLYGKWKNVIFLNVLHSNTYNFHADIFSACLQLSKCLFTHLPQLADEALLSNFFTFKECYVASSCWGIMYKTSHELTKFLWSYTEISGV